MITTSPSFLFHVVVVWRISVTVLAVHYLASQCQHTAVSISSTAHDALHVHASVVFQLQWPSSTIQLDTTTSVVCMDTRHSNNAENVSNVADSKDRLRSFRLYMYSVFRMANFLLAATKITFRMTSFSDWLNKQHVSYGECLIGWISTARFRLTDCLLVKELYIKML